MTTVRRSEGEAPARAALAGNPSDGYGGAVLAVALPDWRARAVATSEQPGIAPANALVQATVHRFAGELEPAATNARLTWRTEIPQRVGLGSSSALVIAVARALCGLYEIQLEATRLAEFALAVETEELGITAGLQDRVAQAYGGLTFMDFSDPPRYEQLRPELLPPLLIAWRTNTAADSGEVHRDLRQRHNRGDEGVRQTMRELARAAHTARDALVAGEVSRFSACVDKTFELRRGIVALNPLCVQMVETARAAGAAANYTGSGGAIVAVCRDDAQVEGVAQALRGVGCEAARAR